MCGLLVLLVTGAFLYFFGVVLALIATVLKWNGLLAAGALMVATLGLLGLAEIGAAIALLYGKPLARKITMAFGIVHLIIIPVGTAVGAYTLWVLLRPAPVRIDGAPPIPLQ